MKLYEIHTAILSLLEQLEPDPETGEMPSNEEEIIAEINALAMRREDILQYLAKLTLNCRAEAAALKAEEARLKKRREPLEAKDKRLVRILDRECGETTNQGAATLSYHPCWDAKNRHGLPEELDLNFASIAPIFESLKTEPITPPRTYPIRKTRNMCCFVEEE